jgi:hypothetical protein
MKSATPTRLVREMLLVAMLFAVGTVSAEREYGGYYTEERIANLRRNCDTFDWAAKQRQEAVAQAKTSLDIPDEQLWRLVQGQDLPRCIDVTMDRNAKDKKRLGCLKCGDKIFSFGNYPYEPDFDRLPWKLTCPSCGVVFPTNDFGRYFDSAIDEHGLFNPAKGNRDLLFNTEHPDPNDPLHLFGVDDGFGYVDANGRSHKFIGYYVWKNWGRIQNSTRALANACLYTGDPVYARKAAILLDRLADVYPAMDWSPYAKRGWYHSDGNRYVGKIGGCIWECETARIFADSWDMIQGGTVECPGLYEFLESKGKQYALPTAKGTREQLVRNIDENILKCSWEAVQTGQIGGNEGMHQRAVATCALALNTEPVTSEWLDWLFEPEGGALPGLIVGNLDRDGLGPEGAPGYAVFWGANFNGIAERLAVYPRYSKHDLYRDYPTFRASLTAGWRMAALGTATPNIGDTGATGLLQRPGVYLEAMAAAYRHSRDPQVASAAWRANGNSSKGLGLDIYSADPEALNREIERVGGGLGHRPVGGSLMSGFGLATIEVGSRSSAFALCCSYGRTSHHGHCDQLNFDLLGFGAWLAPDHGYPEFATSWPSRDAWTHNTLSHNTVVVDGAPQRENWGGHTRFFKQLPGLGAFEISCPSAYSNTSEYARTMMLVETPGGGAYIFDLFEVVGGRDHLYSFHGPPGSVEARGLTLTPQGKGTYAGEAVAFQTMSQSVPLGYSFLHDVRRDAAPPGAFVVDWKIAGPYRSLDEEDDIHLRLHALTSCSDVALADGDPPQNKPGNPRTLTYALLHRQGDGLSSRFVSVIEPYRHAPVIASVERLDLPLTGGVPQQDVPDSQGALRIRLTDGHVDYVLWSSSDDPVRFAEKGVFRGRLGFLRVNQDDAVTSMVLVQGKELGYSDTRLNAEPVYTGKVIGMSHGLDEGGSIIVDTALPADGSLVGQYISVESSSDRDACYQIMQVHKKDDRFVVDCGPISFVRGFKGEQINLRSFSLAKNYTTGFQHDFEEGATFHIVNHAMLSGN